MTRGVKKIVCIISVFILSSSSFAAIVSDNDGSAFVTKAEFDALKNSFNKQIYDYNSGIDGKIDGAISSYLSGIKIYQPPKNYVDKYNTSIGSMPIWLYDFSLTGNSTTTPQKIIRQNVVYNAKICNNLKLYEVWVGIDSGRPPGPPDTKQTDYWSQNLCVGTPVWSGSYGYMQYSIASDRIDYEWFNKHTINRFVPKSEFTSVGWPQDGSKRGTPTYTNDIKKSSYNDSSNGSGSAWIYQIINGNKVLKYYATSVYPKYDVSIDVHYYYYWELKADNANINYYVKKNTRTINASSLPTIASFPKAELGQTVSAGTKVADNSTSFGNAISVNTQLVKTTDLNNYMNVIWGLKTDKQIYALDEDYVGSEGTTAESITTSATSLTYKEDFYNGYGKNLYDCTFPQVTSKYYPITFVKENVKYSDFTNSAFTTIAGTAVKNGGGIPFCETSNDEQTLTLNIKLTDVKSASNHTKCKVTIASEQFTLGSIDNSKILKSFEIYTDDTTPHVESFVLDRKGVVWMFIENLSNTNPIEMTICEVN